MPMKSVIFPGMDSARDAYFVKSAASDGSQPPKSLRPFPRAPIAHAEADLSSLRSCPQRSIPHQERWLIPAIRQATYSISSEVYGALAALTEPAKGCLSRGPKLAGPGSENVCRLQMPMGISPAGRRSVGDKAAVGLAEPFRDRAVAVAQKQVVPAVTIEVAGCSPTSHAGCSQLVAAPLATKLPLAWPSHSMIAPSSVRQSDIVAIVAVEVAGADNLPAVGWVRNCSRPRLVAKSCRSSWPSHSVMPAVVLPPEACRSRPSPLKSPVPATCQSGSAPIAASAPLPTKLPFACPSHSVIAPLLLRRSDVARDRRR